MDTAFQFTETSVDAGATTIFRLKGPLLISNLFEFQAKVRGCESPNLIIDMTEVPYCDSAGIGVLVGAYVSRQKAGRSLLLVGVTPRVRAVLQVTQVEKFFQFADELPQNSAGG